MIAQGMTIRAGPRQWGRLHPLPRGDTAILPKVRGSTQKTCGRRQGIGPPVRFGRARESIWIAQCDSPQLCVCPAGNRRPRDHPRCSQAGPRGRHCGREDIAKSRGHPRWAVSGWGVPVPGVEIARGSCPDHPSGISPPIGVVRTGTRIPFDETMTGGGIDKRTRKNL